MRMRLLGAGLGAAVLVALATWSIRARGGGGIAPEVVSPSTGEVSPSEAVVPPEPPPARGPAGPVSPTSGVARFRGAVETRGGLPADTATRVRLLSSPQDELIAYGALRADGTFEIEARIPPSRLPLIVKLEVDRAGWVPCGPLPGVHLVGSLPFERGEVRLAIAPGTEVRGRVTTVRGESPPVPVRILQPSEESPGTITGFFLRAIADADGSFRALLPSTDRPVVHAQADGYMTVAEEWNAATGEPLEIALPREGDLLQVTGRVVRGDRRTSEAAQITARLLAPSPVALPRWVDRAVIQRIRYLRTKGEEATATQANGMGWYALALPSPGTWILEYRGGFGTAERRVQVGGSGPIRCDVVLEEDTVYFSGSVTDRSTGAPVPGALVRLRYKEGRFRLGGYRGPSSSARTDESGEFRIGPLLRGLEEGDVEVEADGYVSPREKLAFADLGSPPRVALFVAKECRVLGRVVCADRTPAPGVLVDTYPRPESDWIGCEIPILRTNADGRFLVLGLPPGVDIRVRATARSAEGDPCFSASEVIPHDLARVAETVVSGDPGETIDLGDLVLSEVVSSLRGEEEAGRIPRVLPGPIVIPR